jgi:hypothetical protein
MKASKTVYSFVVLRYMHDVFTREFVNIGVLLHAPRAGFLRFEKLSTLDRVKGMFPGLHSESLREILLFLASRTEELRSKTSEQLDRGLLSAETIAKALLPMDDSALQWSAPGGGVTDDLQQTLKELFERLVLRHLKAHPPTRREDADVWKPFERELRERMVLARLQEKTLNVGELRHRFENAWQPQGSYLRLFQALSFDLLQPSDIVEKAVRWGGLIRQLRKDQDFLIYFILGRPSGLGHFQKAFDQAFQTLSEETGRKELVREKEIPRVAAVVEQEIKSFGNN